MELCYLENKRACSLKQQKMSLSVTLSLWSYIRIRRKTFFFGGRNGCSPICQKLPQSWFNTSVMQLQQKCNIKDLSYSLACIHHALDCIILCSCKLIFCKLHYSFFFCQSQCYKWHTVFRCQSIFPFTIQHSFATCVWASCSQQKEGGEVLTWAEIDISLIITDWLKIYLQLFWSIIAWNSKNSKQNSSVRIFYFSLSYIKANLNIFRFLTKLGIWRCHLLALWNYNNKLQFTGFWHFAGQRLNH